MTRLVLFLWVLLLALPAGAQDLTKDSFFEAIEITVPDGSPLARFEITERMYEILVRADLGDLRVWNASNQVLPFDVISADRAGELSVETHATELSLFPYTPDAARDRNNFAIRVDLDADGAVVDVAASEAGSPGAPAYLIDLKEERTILVQLELSWRPAQNNRIASCRLEASNDLQAWRTVSSTGSLAELRVEDESILRNRLPEIALQDERYLRLSWLDPLLAFDLVAANLIEKRTGAQERRSKSFEASRESATDVYEYDTNHLLPAETVQLELPEGSVVTATFEFREEDQAPWTRVRTAHFYRLRGGADEIESEPAKIAETRSRYWRVELHGDTRLEAPKLTLGWQPEYLRFTPREPGPFYITYGSAQAQPAQSNLAAVLEELEKAGQDSKIAEVDVIATQRLAGETALDQPRPWTRIALWTVLLAAVAVLGGMAWRLVRQTG